MVVYDKVKPWMSCCCGSVGSIQVNGLFDVVMILRVFSVMDLPLAVSACAVNGPWSKVYFGNPKFVFC